MPLQLGSQNYPYQDFTEARSGKTCALLADGIVGQGSAKTTIELTGPLTSLFPDPKTIKTTRFNVARIQGPHRLAKPVLSGFTLVVDPQTWPAWSLFNGLRVANADDLLMDDVVVVGVPGAGNLPPYETFGVDLVGCQRPVLRKVIVDGQHISGAGIGLNTTTGALLDRCESFSAGCSHGFTFWNCQIGTLLDCKAWGNGNGTSSCGGVGFNHEETSGIVHVGSRAYGNSLASFRYKGTAASTTGHKLDGCYGDGPVMLEGAQSQADIDMVDALLGPVVRR